MNVSVEVSRFVHELTTHGKPPERVLVNAHVCLFGVVPYLVTMAAILFSRSFLSAFSSNKLNTSSRVMGPVKGFPSPPSPPTELEERRLSILLRRSWPWKVGGDQCAHVRVTKGGTGAGTAMVGSKFCAQETLRAVRGMPLCCGDVGERVAETSCGSMFLR